jgi:hypothetical protein
MPRRIAGFLLGVAIGAVPVAAQQPVPPAANTGAAAITPLKGQTAEKSALDDAECKNGATTASGYVPGAPPAAAPAPQGPGGQRLAGAARGAAAGAVVGEVQGNHYSNAPEGIRDEHTQNQAKTGAAVGVMAGGARARQGRRQAAQAQQASGQQQAAAQTAWQNSYKSCLTQRGYSVP